MMIKTAILVFCLGVMFCPQAFAQLFLEQGKLNLDVDPGERYSGSLIIHNNSTSEVSLKIYWEDFKYKAPYDGSKDFMPAGTLPGSARDWVVFSPQTFTIPPNSQQSVDYTVIVPSQIQEGHYGVLFFETSNPSAEAKEAVNIVERIGTLFFIEPKTKNKQALLQNPAIKGGSVVMDYVNQGNIIEIPHTTYYIMQDSGEVALRGEAKKLYVPPGASASLEIPVKKKLAAGHYTLMVNSDLEQGDVAVKEAALTVDDSGQMTVENTNN